MLDSLFSNPALQSIILSKLKKVMKKEGIKVLGIYIDENDEIKFSVYKEDVKIVTVTKLEELIKLANNE